MTDFRFMVLFPASVLHSFNTESIDLQTRLDSGKLILVGAVWLAVPFVLTLWITKLAAQCVLVSTVLSLITIPILTVLGGQV